MARLQNATCIRKYGSNNKGTLFIIEAGRRAPQGEGMYAFRTKEADEMRRGSTTMRESFGCALFHDLLKPAENYSSKV
jgi:hypothetical protein